MIPVSWAMFSSAPVLQLNIPPTLVPTTNMFSVLPLFPTLLPTLFPTSMIQPKIITSPTISPTNVQTISPTTTTPSFRPSFQPTIDNPTLVPTISLLQTTLFPTQNNIGLSSINTNQYPTSTSSTTIGAIVGSIILLLIFIGICVFMINKNSKDKKSPYEIWSAYYNSKSDNNINQTNTITTPNNMDNDIHHFYSKSQRPSIYPAPSFTPHISNKSTTRNSTIDKPLGSQRNSQRISSYQKNYML